MTKNLKGLLELDKKNRFPVLDFIQGLIIDWYEDKGNKPEAAERAAEKEMEKLYALFSLGQQSTLQEVEEERKSDLLLILDFVERWNKQDKESNVSQAAQRLEEYLK